MFRFIPFEIRILANRSTKGSDTVGRLGINLRLLFNRPKKLRTSAPVYGSRAPTTALTLTSDGPTRLSNRTQPINTILDMLNWHFSLFRVIPLSLRTTFASHISCFDWLSACYIMSSIMLLRPCNTCCWPFDTISGA